MVDDRMRRELHERLDQLLDTRNEIEVPSLNYLGSLTLGSHQVNDAWAATKLYTTGISFLREVLGEAVICAALPRTYENDENQRALLLNWLTFLLPLIDAPPHSLLSIAPMREMTIYDVLNAISALNAGEIQPLFRANTGKNRRANRYTLAQAKLQALVWKKRLEALGHSGKSANYEVMVAFGEQWDTIRRWQPQCEEILGSTHVDFILRLAGNSNDIYVKPPRSGMFGSWRPDPKADLARAGESYRAELKRSAELSKAKASDVA